MSFNVEYNIKEINLIILENILKMLQRRKLIDNINTEFEKIKDSVDNNKSVIEILLNNKNYYHVFIISSKLMSIVQGTSLDDFLSNNIEIHKIVIGKNVAKKVVKQILNEYKNSEFFFESDMLEDIPSKVFIPHHEIMLPEEKEELLSKFSESSLSHILVTDMMARYYNAKIGDIIKITRSSITSGKNIFYRKVVNGTIDILFI
jgi:DNA-directed RNA polymerase subunit H (RpoH/RPB5)